MYNAYENLVICIEDKNINKFLSPKKCLSFGCPNNWRLIRKVIYNNTCFDTCKNINQYLYKDDCINKCPENEKFITIITSRENYCEKKCQKLKPFLLINNNECVDYCSFNDIYEELCLLSYNSDEKKDIILNNTLRFIQNNDFPKEIIEKDGAIILEENIVKFNISKINQIKLRR